MDSVVTASHHSIMNYFHITECPIVVFSFHAVEMTRNHLLKNKYKKQ